ncbi:MAG: flagellin [Phycisphaerales bacterium]
MSILPANVSRVSNLLSSQLSLANINRTNAGLLRLQTQLATGRLVNRPSDDPVRALSIAALDSRLELHAQRRQNLDHAQGVTGLLDTTLGEVRTLVDQAYSIASSQIGIQSDPETRQGFATQLDSIIQSLLTFANKELSGVHLFGGSTPGRPPIQQLAGGFRYIARGNGLLTDLGLGDSVPITLGSGSAIGDVSARVRGQPVLAPNLEPAALLSSLNGARGVGVSPGSFTFQFNGGPVGTVDLSGAQSVQDAINQITAAIRSYETANSVTVLGPGAVGVAGGSLSFDIVAGGSLTFADATGGSTALDLGLAQAAFTPGNPNSVGLAPRLTLESTLAQIPGLTLPIDSIRLRFTQGGVSTFRDVDLSSATTIDQLRNLVETNVPGVRVTINSAGTGIDILNEIAGQNLSVEEVAGGADTATALGIRSLAATTAAADFNHGRGVRIVTGQVDPVSGAPDPARDRDFRITLGNGQAFDVDLRPQDLTSVQAILDRINAEFTTAVGQAPINPSAPALVAGDLVATLTNGANGIALVQSAGASAGAAISVSALNNSAAAEDLGFVGGAYNGATLTFQAQDRATVRVDNLFSDLLDLRAAIASSNSTGITVAAQSLRSSGERVTQAHALVAGFAQRIDRALDQLESTVTIDTQTKSELQDLDFTEAATRFSLLQTQLQASLQTAGQFQSVTLLDFLR